MNKYNTFENKHRVEHECKIPDDVMFTNNTAYRRENPFKGPFVITQCFINRTVKLQYGPTKIRYNIHRINPYKYDTKVEDSKSINISDDVSI